MSCLLSRLQVTNPPIDPLREGLVMSLEMRLGGRGNLLQTGEGELGGGTSSVRGSRSGSSRASGKLDPAALRPAVAAPPLPFASNLM